jgi:hypothetical protein
MKSRYSTSEILKKDQIQLNLQPNNEGILEDQKIKYS